MKKNILKTLALAAVLTAGISHSAIADWDDHRDRDRDWDHDGHRHHVIVEREYYGGPYNYHPRVYHPYYTYVEPQPVYVAPAPVYAPPVASFNFRF